MPQGTSHYTKKDIPKDVCVGAQAIPISEQLSIKEHHLDVSEKVAEMEEKVDFLEESSLIPEKTVEELKESLEDLSTQNDAKDPGKTYELLDAVAKRLEYAAGMAYENLETKAAAKEQFSAKLQEMLQEVLADPALNDRALLLKKHGLMPN